MWGGAPAPRGPPWARCSAVEPSPNRPQGTPKLLTTTRRVRALVRRSGSRLRGNSPWARRRCTVKHPFDTEIFVDVRPVHSLARPDDSKSCALGRAGLGQTPGPRKRHTDDATVLQV